MIATPSTDDDSGAEEVGVVRSAGFPEEPPTPDMACQPTETLSKQALLGRLGHCGRLNNSHSDDVVTGPDAVVWAVRAYEPKLCVELKLSGVDRVLDFLRVRDL
jgi:hypothetical protein